MTETAMFWLLCALCAFTCWISLKSAERCRKLCDFVKQLKDAVIDSPAVHEDPDK